MEFSIVKAISSSELREHANEHFIYVNFPFGKEDDEMRMLEALKHSRQLCTEGMCNKCNIAMKSDKKGYLYIEFILERNPDTKEKKGVN
jgi:hypothetical protein